MNLTEKCKEKFIFWMCENYEYVRWHEYEDMPECALNALIIEWLDSVGIYIELLYFVDGNYFVATVYHNDGYDRIGDFDTRTEATNEAIIKANDLYNETLKKC